MEAQALNPDKERVIAMAQNKEQMAKELARKHDVKIQDWIAKIRSWHSDIVLRLSAVR